jgi:hypothetical protein
MAAAASKAAGYASLRPLARETGAGILRRYPLFFDRGDYISARRERR